MMDNNVVCVATCMCLTKRKQGPYFCFDISQNVIKVLDA